MNTKPLQIRSAANRPEATWKGVYRTLRLAILNRELLPSSRLIEIDLSAALGVSRTPLREALARLEVDGLVTATRSGGYIVSDLREDLVDAYHLRSAIEGYAARLAAGRISAEELQTLQRNVAESEHVPLTDRQTRAQMNLEFHQVLAEASRSAKIIHAFNNIRDLILTDEDMSLHSEDIYRRFIREHGLIVVALEMRDGDLADRIVRLHLTNAVDLLLRDRPLDPKS
jgi:DNA-binding GntR family transcriptional regulator